MVTDEKKWVKGSRHVCGMTKGPPRHRTWWCNRDVEEIVANGKVCDKASFKSASAETNMFQMQAKGSIHNCTGGPGYKNSRLIFRVINLVGRTASGLLEREMMSSVCAA